MARARLEVVEEQRHPVGAPPRSKERPRADHFDDLAQFEAKLWGIADDLRANSNLASNEYFMPIMGLIFLRHASNRFYEAKAAIEADQAAGRLVPLVDGDLVPDRVPLLRHGKPDGPRADHPARVADAGIGKLNVTALLRKVVVHRPTRDLVR